MDLPQCFDTDYFLQVKSEAASIICPALIDGLFSRVFVAKVGAKQLRELNNGGHLAAR